jgi:tetratricopeptide (TPR) repeat protein
MMVVTGEGVRLREAGSTTAQTIGTAAQGEELGKVGQRGNWFEVVMSDGRKGWIWRELVRPKTFAEAALAAAEVVEAPPEEAAAPEQEAVEVFPPPVRRNIYAEGLQSAAAGDPARALAFFSEVLEEDPDHLNALVHAARAHKQLGSYDQALDLLYQAMELGEGRRDIYVALAEVYRLGGMPDSAAKYQALYRGEKWRPSQIQPGEKALETKGEMPAEAWWIYGAGGMGVVLLLGGGLVVRRLRKEPIKPVKEAQSKAGKGKFARQMRQSRETGAVGRGEEAELDRQIQQKRGDLQQSSVAFLGPDALAQVGAGSEDAHMEQVLGHVETLRKALEAQDERARIYADIVRLQNAKIEAMSRELDLLRKRGRG